MAAAGAGCGGSRSLPRVRAAADIEPVYAGTGVAELGPLAQHEMCSGAYGERVRALENPAVRGKLRELWGAVFPPQRARACQEALDALPGGVEWTSHDTCEPEPEQRALRDRVDRCLVEVAWTPRAESDVLTLAGMGWIPPFGDVPKEMREFLNEAPDKMSGAAARAAPRAGAPSPDECKDVFSELGRDQKPTLDQALHMNFCIRTGVEQGWFREDEATDGELRERQQSLVATGAGTAASAALADAGAGAPLGYEAALLTGIADFIADRAQEEVLNYAVDAFGKRLCQSDLDGYEVRSFFPETCHLLSGGGELGHGTLPRLGSSFQAALQADIHDLLPVLLAFATARAEARGLDPAVAEFASALVAGLLEGKAPLEHFGDPSAELDAVAARCDDSADAEHDAGADQACALELMVRLLRIAGDACEPATARCLADVGDELRDELGERPALAQWVDEHGAGVVAAISGASALERAVRALVEAEGSARFAKLSQLLQAVAELLPPEQRETVRRVVAVVDPVFQQWGALGVALYQAIRGVARGHAPLPLVVAALEAVPCSAVGDPRCGFRAAGVLVETVLTARYERGGEEIDWRDLTERIAGGTLAPDEVAGYLEAARHRWVGILLRPGNEIVRDWVDAHLKPPGSAPVTWRIGAPLGERRIEDLLSATMQALLRFHRAVTAARETVDSAAPEQREALQAAAAAAVAGAMFDVWRAIIPLVVAEGLQDDALAVVDALDTAWAAARERRWASFVQTLYALARRISPQDPIPPPLRRYVPLVTALAEARSAGEVSGALDKMAAPVGGHRFKRQPGWHGSISALVGVTGGYERGDEPDLHTALFAPLGADITRGAWGVFVPVIDVGALTATSLGIGDSDADLPEPRFAQVLAPGLHVRYALGRSPFVLGAGGSVIPALRPGEAVDEEAALAYRVHAFLAVDITILPFDLGD